MLAVNPGWSGQSFLQSAGRPLSDLGEFIDGRETVIGIDGGITKTNIEQVASLGVDLIVTGSAVYAGTGAAENAQFMVEPVHQSRDRAGSLGGSRGDLLWARRLADHGVVVTGAAQGIGRSLIRAFEAEGAGVVAVDRNPAVMEFVGETAFPSSATLRSTTIADAQLRHASSASGRST